MLDLRRRKGPTWLCLGVCMGVFVAAMACAPDAARQGFEIVAVFVNSPEQALEAWTNDPDLRSFLLNFDDWEASPWLAIGAELRDEHAVVWLGTAPDPDER